MSDLFIPVLEGTVRPKRRSIAAAKLVVEVLEEYDGVRTQLVDPVDYSFPLDGESDSVKDPKYSKLTAEADAFILIIPEYNHSFPATLKRMLDSELKNYAHKPVALVGVSGGNWGGVRAIQSMVPVVRELGMVATYKDMMFPNMKKVLDEEGNLIDKDSYKPRIIKAVDELVWMTKAMKWGRENL